MDTTQKITIAVVTKQRQSKLFRLLESITQQSVLPDSVLVIDNDQVGSAKKIVDTFRYKIPIEYEVERKQGVPFARNTALNIVTTDFIAFVDDDCVLGQDWFATAKKVVNNVPSVGFFIGNSQLLNPDSFVAQAQYRHQKYWFHQKLEKNTICSAFNVDTKNIILNVSQLKKNKVSFDTNISIGWFDSADTDLGFQMEDKGLLGVYVENLKLLHEETESLKYFVTKGYYRGKLAKMLANKWKIKGEFVYLPFKSWWKYLKSIRFWKKEFFWYYSKFSVFNLVSFLCLKTYERVFFFGYLSEK